MTPEGEQNSGEPTIVSLYVFPEFRKQGVGGKLLSAAIDFLLNQGFSLIRMDVLSTKIAPMIAKLIVLSSVFYFLVEAGGKKK